MSNSILQSFIGKLRGTLGVGLRRCKYLKNDNWRKHEIFQEPFK